MDSDKALVIGYAGSLSYFDGKKNKKLLFSLRDWCWTYNHKVTDPSTRSAYYLFEALKVLREKNNITSSQIRVDFWGSIDARNIEMARKMGIDDLVRFDGFLPKQESRNRIDKCDLLFLPMESATGNNKPLFIPGKVFEYMKSEKPILALAGPCDCIDILQPSGLLLAFQPTATEEIANALFLLLSDRQLLTKYIPNEEYINGFSFENRTRKLASIFNDVLNQT